MNPKEPKMRHLEMIQEIVKRMAGNLFFLKGWSVTLIAGTFALAAKEANENYLILAYFPLIMFWGLDGYFLSQERLFRALYEDVRKKLDTNIDFSMNTEPFKSAYRNTWFGAITSGTLASFYVPLLILVLLFTYFTLINS